MINEQLFQLNNLLNIIFYQQAQEKTINSKLLYALKRNKDIIEPEINRLREELIAETKPTKEIEDRNAEFEAKRMDACSERSEKDENGKPIVENGNFKIFVDKREELNQAIQDLTKEYNDVFEFRKTQMAKERELLMKPIAIENLYKIKLEWLPDTGLITPELMNVLYDLIEEK